MTSRLSSLALLLERARPEELPELVGEIEALRARAWSRITTEASAATRPASVAGPRGVLRTPEAARHCGVSASFLARLRLEGGGPRFIKHGRNSVLYDPKDLDEWLEQRKQGSTSEEAERV